MECADLLGWTDAPFDVALLYNGYPHFPQRIPLLKRVWALLRKGGRFTVAHSMGRQALNHHHQGIPSEVTSHLHPAAVEAALWAPWFEVDVLVDGSVLYMISGVKK